MTTAYEKRALALTVVAVCGATVAPLYYETRAIRAHAPSNAQVITLTGVSHTGTWTEAEVHGSDYWSEKFRPARPVLRVGVPVLLRLKSADVTHTFYSPGLGIGPLDVSPGHVVEVLVTPSHEGSFDYYCTTVCGAPHFAMRGQMVVGGGSAAAIPKAPDRDKYWLVPPPPAGASPEEHGAWLFRQKGCVTCHGPEGHGGVANWNYVTDTIPPLSNLSEKIFLFSPEDVEAVVDLIRRGVPLESVEDSPPVPRFDAVMAQYSSTRNLIRKGNPPGKKDPKGLTPPLGMLAWEHRLTDAEIDSLLIYLLTRQHDGEAQN